MIEKIRVVNFKSILDETISLKYSEKKAPNNYKELDSIVFLENSIQERCIPILMIFGANASGKTNLIEATRVFSLIFDVGIEGLYFPNKINRKYDSTRFEISFIIDDNRYDYSLEYNLNHIIEEKFLMDNKILFSINISKDLDDKYGKYLKDFTNLYKENYGEAELSQVFDVECRDEKRNQIKPFLFKIANKYSGLNTYLTEAMKFLKFNIFILKSNVFNPLDIKKLFFDNSNSDQEEQFKKVINIIKKLDIDISKFILKDDKIITYHKDIENNEVAFDFLKEESSGTQRLFGVLSILIFILDNGGILFIDEIDDSLHPFIVSYLIDLFKNKQYNKKNAQLILTAHNPYIMEDNSVRISEVAFANKTLQSGTKLRYLYQFKEVRNITDFVKQYLQGRFTGVPLIY